MACTCVIMKRTFLYRLSLDVLPQEDPAEWPRFRDGAVERDLPEETVYHKSHMSCTWIESGPPDKSQLSTTR
jgi:hypothetical protein